MYYVTLDLSKFHNNICHEQMLHRWTNMNSHKLVHRLYENVEVTASAIRSRKIYTSKFPKTYTSFEFIMTKWWYNLYRTIKITIWPINNIDNYTPYRHPHVGFIKLDKNYNIKVIFSNVQNKNIF